MTFCKNKLKYAFELDFFHSLDCKKGILVTAHHNEICDGVADLANKAFTPTHVHDGPLIFEGCAIKTKRAQLDGSKLPSLKKNPEAI